MRTAASCLFGALLAACSATLSGTIGITLGGETDTLSRAPAPTTLAVDLVDFDGGVTNLATIALPASSADLGDISTDQAGSIHVTGRDATGAVRVRGATLPVDMGALDGLTLNVFVQRVSELARMPGALADAREAPLTTLLDGRYVLLASGADPTQATSTVLYDLLSLQNLTGAPVLPRAPKSLAVSGTNVLVIDDTGGTLMDVAAATSSEVTLPAGQSFADLAGGASVQAADGGVYLVGATRTTSPSATVLHMATDGTITFASLTTLRAGAAVAYVNGRGLAVFGGSGTAPGLELLADGATVGIGASFAPQNVVGASLAALDRDHLVAAWTAGTSGTFLPLDLNHPEAATPVTATLPCSVKHLDFVGLDATSALGVGEDGPSCAFRWNGVAVTPVPLNVARRGARAIALPTGAVGIVGGATTVESFFP